MPTPQEKWQKEKSGTVLGKYRKEFVDEFKEACKKLGTFDLSGCVIYTTGQPCPMCLAAILWANIDKVYYGCNIEDTNTIGFRDSAFFEYQNDPEKLKEFVTEMDRKACLKLYEQYKNIKDKTHY